MHFGCGKLVKQHGSTCSTRWTGLARHDRLDELDWLNTSNMSSPCIELVEQHGSTHSSRRAWHVKCVVSCQEVTSQVEFGLMFVISPALQIQWWWKWWQKRTDEVQTVSAACQSKPPASPPSSTGYTSSLGCSWWAEIGRTSATCRLPLRAVRAAEHPVESRSRGPTEARAAGNPATFGAGQASLLPATSCCLPTINQSVSF